jgi:Domain of unknown function (DUF4491)
VNTFGLLAGLTTVLIIGLGFPLVIHVERLFGYASWPYLLAIGMLLIAGSAFVPNGWLSVAVGVAGATFAWGSTELSAQAVRAEMGWYPYNPDKIRLPLADIIQKWRAPHL